MSALDQLRRDLDRALGSGRVLARGEVEPESLTPFSKDWSGMEPRAPDLVVHPNSTDEVCDILRLAQEHRIPVTPRGMGSGKSGGSVPVDGGLVVSMDRFTGVEEVSTGDLVTVVRAGTPLQAVYDAVESEGLFYPPDPNSAHLCSIGGNVACNAGGPRALKYGVTKHYVLGVEAVTPVAGAIRLGSRGVKHAAGLDLTSLMVGSEGLLGIMTRVVLRLLPRPRGVRTAIVFFSDVDAASAAVTHTFVQGVLPRCLELLDDAATAAVRKDLSDLVPDGAGATLIVEADGADQDAADQELARVVELLEPRAIASEVAATPAQRERIWAPRRMMSESLRRTAARKVSEDVTVPRSRVPELLRRLRDVADAIGVRIAAYGHAGDGNMHVNILFDEDQEDASRSALRAVAELAVELQGTISGEHGVGYVKRDLLEVEQSQPVIALQRSLKQRFDPHGILNPGKVFPVKRATE